MPRNFKPTIRTILEKGGEWEPKKIEAKIPTIAKKTIYKAIESLRKDDPDIHRKPFLPPNIKLLAFNEYRKGFPSLNHYVYYFDPKDNTSWQVEDKRNVIDIGRLFQEHIKECKTFDQEKKQRKIEEWSNEYSLGIKSKKCKERYMQIDMKTPKKISSKNVTSN